MQTLSDGTSQSMHEWFASPEGSKMMTKFWAYMGKQWFKPGMIDLWNLSEWIAENYALEGYNYQFQQSIGRKHPNLAVFASCLNDEAEKQVRRLDYVATGRETAKEYKDIPFPSVPSEYADFEASPLNGSVSLVRSQSLRRRLHLPPLEFPRLRSLQKLSLHH